MTSSGQDHAPKIRKKQSCRTYFLFLNVYMFVIKRKKIKKCFQLKITISWQHCQLLRSEIASVAKVMAKNMQFCPFLQKFATRRWSERWLLFHHPQRACNLMGAKSSRWGKLRPQKFFHCFSGERTYFDV